MTYIYKVLRPSAFLDMVLQASASCLNTVPRPSSMTCFDKVPWPSACLDTVTRPSACLDTVPRPIVMTFLDKAPWPIACLDMVTQLRACIDTMPLLCVMTCLDKVLSFNAFLDTVPRPNANTCKLGSSWTGRDVDPVASKGRGKKDKSRDPIASLEGRVNRLEVTMADTKEGMDMVEQSMEKAVEDLKVQIQDLQESVQGSPVPVVS